MIFIFPTRSQEKARTTPILNSLNYKRRRIGPSVRFVSLLKMLSLALSVIISWFIVSETGLPNSMIPLLLSLPDFGIFPSLNWEQLYYTVLGQPDGSFDLYILVFLA